MSLLIEMTSELLFLDSMMTQNRNGHNLKINLKITNSLMKKMTLKNIIMTFSS
jgi:hypothetical protein